MTFRVYDIYKREYIWLPNLFLKLNFLNFIITKSCLPISLRSFPVVLQRKIGFFFFSLRLRFFGMQTEVLSFKPELPIKFTGFTEATLCFSLSWTFAPGAKHSCTSRIRRTVFANTGFKMMI